MNANDVTMHGYPPIHPSLSPFQGSSAAEVRNLPLDQYGGVDWAKMRELQLRGYPTEELKAEITRREVEGYA